MTTENTAVIEKKTETLQNILNLNKAQIEAALPKHLTADRLLRIAMTEARKNPVLLECSQTSFIGAIIQTAQLGLEPGGALGHSYLVPFKNKKTGQTDVQFIVGYRGMMDLSYRSPHVDRVVARAVYEGDKFFFQYGTEEKIEHIPDLEANGQKLTHVYAIVFLKSGGKIFDVMEKKEIESTRKRSKAAESGPWETDYEAMAKKSVVRRLFKYSPVSIELQNAIGLDEAAERGEQQNGSFIETTAEHVPENRATKLSGIIAEEKTKQKPTESAQPIPISKPSQDGRIELGKEINAVKKALGWTNEQFATNVLQQFEKPTAQLTVDEMKELLFMMNQDLQERDGV